MVTWQTDDTADPIVIAGASTDVPTNSSALFLCLASPADGQFTVPDYVLSSLPATRSQRALNFGILYVGALPLQNATSFVASGLDAGFALGFRKRQECELPMTPGPYAVCLLTLILLLSGCTPGGGLTSLPFGKCKLPNGAQSYGYVFNNDGNIGACFSTPKTIAVTSLVTFNLPPDTVKLWNDDGTSFTLSGVIQPQDFSMAAAGPVYMLDNSPSNQRIALIDPQSGKITAQIPLPQAVYSTSAIAVSLDGKFLYVTKSKAELSVATVPSSVVVVNLATNKVDTEIVLPATVAPQGGIAITPDAQFAYVPVSISIPGTPVTYSIYVLDIAARKVSTIIPFPDSAIPVHTAVTPGWNFRHEGGGTARPSMSHHTHRRRTS